MHGLQQQCTPGPCDDIALWLQVVEILTEEEGGTQRATGVRLADGRVLRARTVISNATHWDTFDRLMPHSRLPQSEERFRQRYKKSPAFLTIHAGIRADALPPGAGDCSPAWLSVVGIASRHCA